MFWGSFYGNKKGPSCLWEKEWGSINTESYITYILPLIEECIRQDSQLQFMQDGAPGHRSKATKAELLRRGIQLILWPPYSPDLNPIETVWDWIKDYLENNFPERMSYGELRVAIREA